MKININFMFQDSLPVRNFHTNSVLEMLIFKFNGGTVCKNIDNNTTHVVIHSRYVCNFLNCTSLSELKLLLFLF